MAEYQLVDDFYLLPTAAGAFFAVSSPDKDPVRDLLLQLLGRHSTPKAGVAQLMQWLGAGDEQTALRLLHRAQTRSFIQGVRERRDVIATGMGQGLQDQLSPLSSVGKGLLVDWNGLSLARSGLDEETADVVSALSADLIAVQKRHAARLSDYLGLGIQGWAAVDAYGASRIGAWPLFVGDERFMLVLLGEPRLNRAEFVNLVWVLISRYGVKPAGAK